MQINWKLRIKNKVTLTAIVAVIIGVVYTVLSWCGIVPPVEQEEILKCAAAIIEILILLGIVVDPTTEGLNDSDRAMQYEDP
ncbi:MAG: phage holin [Eubacterium sp.]|nr:phage holin [Candidatus Colimonas fimequi]